MPKKKSVKPKPKPKSKRKPTKRTPRMRWTKAKKKEFLKYLIVDELKARQIQKKLGITRNQYAGIRKRYKQGGMDKLVQEVLYEEGVVPDKKEDTTCKPGTWAKIMNFKGNLPDGKTVLEDIKKRKILGKLPPEFVIGKTVYVWNVSDISGKPMVVLGYHDKKIDDDLFWTVIMLQSNVLCGKRKPRSRVPPLPEPAREDEEFPDEEIPDELPEILPEPEDFPEYEDDEEYPDIPDDEDEDEDEDEEPELPEELRPDIPEPEPDPEPGPEPTPAPPITPIPFPFPTFKPTEDEYTPEGNVDEEGGGVSADPPCKRIFTLVSSPDSTHPGSGIDRMKRSLARTGVRPADDQPGHYTFYFDIERKYKNVTPESVPSGYMIWDGEVKNAQLEERMSIPTPAPRSVMLSGYKALDQDGGSVLVKWEKDQYYNWYLSPLNASDIGRIVTVTWRVACPLLSENYWLDVGDFSDDTLPQDEWNPDTLPEDMYDLADELIDHLGISSEDGLVKCIAKLGKHCATFGCGIIPEGDVVKESFFAKEGACRTRAEDFFIAAARLGIACRYVVSDCHAYVELMHPDKNIWVALDLGGCDPPGAEGGDPIPRNPDDLNPPSPSEPPEPLDPTIEELIDKLTGDDGTGVKELELVFGGDDNA